MVVLLALAFLVVPLLELAVIIKIGAAIGVLNTIGSLGIKISGPVAFNIISAKADDNAAWLVTDGAAYTVDLKTGKATMAGKISGLTDAVVTLELQEKVRVKVLRSSITGKPPAPGAPAESNAK